MPKKHSPRKGSMGYKRKRAKKDLPSVSNWPEVTTPTLLGFPAYKCGMLTLYAEKEIKTRYQEVFGKDTTMAATTLEAPPIRVLAVRTYMNTPYGLKTMGEVWVPTFSKFEEEYLERCVNLPKDYTEEEKEERIKASSENLDEVNEVRVIARTMPELTGIDRKKPKLLEIGVGGDVEEAFEFAVERLGKKIQVGEVFERDDLVDSIGVTKGHGFQGVVKRFGVRLLPPKTKKGQRKVAAMGPFSPGRTSWRVPQAGQTGFHKRTEFNKQILGILDEEEAKNFNPSGGWKHYGVLKQPAVILKGSVQGPQKRTLILREPIRPKETEDLKVTDAWYSDEKLKEF